MPVCEECGFGYVETIPSNVCAHRYVHDRTVNGPRTTRPDGIYFVNPSSPRGLRSITYGAAQLAQNDTQYDFPCFTVWDRPDPQYQPEAAIQVLQNRVVGLVVTRIRPCRFRAPLDSFADRDGFGWRPTDGERVPREHRRSIDMLWVLAERRGGGDIAWALVEAIARHCGTNVEALGHCLPFTAAAVRFWLNRDLTEVYLV
jgi:hypothetical protein